jgi:hypothetical protein
MSSLILCPTMFTQNPSHANHSWCLDARPAYPPEVPCGLAETAQVRALPSKATPWLNLDPHVGSYHKKTANHSAGVKIVAASEQITRSAPGELSLG